VIDAICRPIKLPVICGEENLCKGCGVATLSIDYFNLGKKTGQMAVEILKDGKDISKMPIAYDENPVKKYNKAICEDLGLSAPEGYVEIA
jgi:putative ABC transport system substrate-binding protein